MAGLKIATPAINEPVDLTMLKNHMHVDTTTDDDLINVYLETVRQKVEGFLGRSLINKTYRQSFDHFPHYHGRDRMAASSDYGHYLRGHAHPLEIKLGRSPLVAVSNIEYLDLNGVLQTLMPDADFIVDYDGEPGRIFPNVTAGTYLWPATQRVPNAVRVTFTAGYGDDPDDVPALFRTAIMIYVKGLYDFRDPFLATPGAKAMEMPSHLRDLLWEDRIKDFAPTEG
jgi:uncharacterized phiE125 gp8 family phage protein